MARKASKPTQVLVSSHATAEMSRTNAKTAVRLAQIERALADTDYSMDDFAPLLTKAFIKDTLGGEFPSLHNASGAKYIDNACKAVSKLAEGSTVTLLLCGYQTDTVLLCSLLDTCNQNGITLEAIPYEPISIIEEKPAKKEKAKKETPTVKMFGA